LGKWRRWSWGGGVMHGTCSRRRTTAEVRFKKDRIETNWLGEKGSRKMIGLKQ